MEVTRRSLERSGWIWWGNKNDIFVTLYKILIMSTIELKERLIDKINHTEDENVLAEVNRLLSLDTETEEIYHFTETEKIKINEAQLQIKNGDFITHNEI